MIRLYHWGSYIQCSFRRSGGGRNPHILGLDLHLLHSKWVKVLFPIITPARFPWWNQFRNCFSSCDLNWITLRVWFSTKLVEKKLSEIPPSSTPSFVKSETNCGDAEEFFPDDCDPSECLLFLITFPIFLDPASDLMTLRCNVKS